MIEIDILGYQTINPCDELYYKVPILAIRIEGRLAVLCDGNNVFGSFADREEDQKHWDMYWEFVYNNPSKFFEGLSVPLSEVDQKLWHHNYLGELA